jgi:Right handed beta helix region
MNRQRRGMATWTIRWALAIVAAGVLIAPATEAATTRVAIDGSGDFTVLPDAIAAAASGDTISIAPGVYDQTRTIAPSGNPVEVMGWAIVSQLTILGDNRDTVIIGPATPAPNLEFGPTGITTGFGASLTVRGITVRNLNQGIFAVGPSVEVTDCILDGNHFGVDSSATVGTTVRNCRFVNQEDRGIIVFNSLSGRNVLVENCDFTDNLVGIDVQVPGSVINNCSFQGGRGGFQVSFGGEATVNNCTFENIENRGVSVTNFSDVQLYGNTFIPPMGECLVVSGGLTGSDNELLGGWYATINIGWSSTVNFFNNHILNGGGYSILALGGIRPPNQIMDFSNNYWGTVDPSQIDAWIWDTNDDPFVRVEIDYTPFIDQPVEVESTSFGEIKARYGQDE